MKNAKELGFTMNRIKKSEETNYNRRRFLGVAAMTVASAEFAMLGNANAQSSETAAAGASTFKPGTNTSFAPLMQIDAGVLNIGYAEAGPADGTVVLLLHGWPYDIYS